jgi:hypothetical protein
MHQSFTAFFINITGQYLCSDDDVPIIVYIDEGSSLRKDITFSAFEIIVLFKLIYKC